MIHVNDVLYLIDLDDTPITALNKRYDLQIEHVFDDVSTITFKIPNIITVIPEQQIIFRKQRYQITAIEEIKIEKALSITGESAFIEMSSENVEKIETTDSLSAIASKALSKSKWELGWIDSNDKQYSVFFENKSVLYILKQLAKLADCYIEYDTINRIVNFRNEIGKNLDFVFRYRKNIKEIKKKTFAPTATVIYPYGKGGLTIESVNGGKKYIEDYSWYESLGIDIEEARKRFAKTYVLNDERFIYAGNLMREAQIKLRELAHPQISYETEITHLDRDVDIGDFGYIVDEELGIKVRVRIVRLVEFEQTKKNTVEFNYLIPGIHESDDFSSTSDIGKESNIIMVKNESPVSISENYQLLLRMNITTFASTNAQVGFSLIGQASSNSLLEGYFELGTERVGYEIKQVLQTGWNTIGLPFIIPQIQDGSQELKFFAKVSSGTLNVDTHNVELFIVAENLLGGMSSELPKADIVEEVELENLDIFDTHVITRQTPIEKGISDYVQFTTLNVGDKVSIELEDA